ncbi:MAG: hypothetical protein AAFV54_04135 [Pseudomonadota bacterium]
MKRLQELQEKWEYLLEVEEDVFRRCVSLDQSPEPVSEEEKSAALREWWGCANSILWMMARTKAQHGHELLPHPIVTLARLANISEEISNGKIPRFVSDARKRGRPLWRKERHCIANAVQYIDATKDGTIFDPHPTKTVSNAFNVTPRAVGKWQERKAELLVGVPMGRTAMEIADKMRKAGAVYSKLGRGAPSR